MTAPVVNGLLSTADLLQASGFESVGALRRSLKEQGVPYFLGKDGRPWTTIPLLTAAKLETKVQGDADRFSPAML